MRTADTWARAGFVLLCIVMVVGVVVYPTYPNYDSYYSLLWGREILDATLPNFEGFRVPTEHPLAIVAGTVLAVIGEPADRVWILLTFASFLALVAGVYRLGRISFTPLVGGIAAVLLLTRFDFPFLAARGYIDIPFMALVVWAVALEAQRPRRGWPVFALLTAAGLLRVEGWFLAGLYFLWMNARRDEPLIHRAAWAAWAAAAPVGWCLVDFAVTGDPLFSVHHTSGLAEDLGRSRSLSELPSELPGFLADLVKLPVLACATIGFVLAVLLAPRRAVWPVVLFVSGLATFVAIGAAGASIIERYLVIASLALLIFAAVALGGWTMLEPSRARTAWMWTAGVVVVAGLVFTIVNLNLKRFQSELTFRGDAHEALVEVLDAPEVQDALDCGPLTLPNHKLVPDARWVADLPFEKVWSRAEQYRQKDPRKPADGGVAIYVTSRFAIFKHAFTDDSDPAVIQVPPDGWEPVARSEHYAAYARC